MATSRLSHDEATRLQRAPFTYAEVELTRDDVLPSGYHHLSRSVVVGRGRPRFDEVARHLMSWQVQRLAGVAVRAAGEQVGPGAVAELRLGRGPLAITAPVRVAYVVGEADRCGFAYGTLPGHPESGEESFLVALDGDGTVRFSIAAFSRPASPLARVGGPLGRAVQLLVTHRYLRAAAHAPHR